MSQQAAEPHCEGGGKPEERGAAPRLEPAGVFSDTLRKLGKKGLLEALEAHDEAVEVMTRFYAGKFVSSRKSGRSATGSSGSTTASTTRGKPSGARTPTAPTAPTAPLAECSRASATRSLRSREPASKEPAFFRPEKLKRRGLHRQSSKPAAMPQVVDAESLRTQEDLSSSDEEDPSSDEEDLSEGDEVPGSEAELFEIIDAIFPVISQEIGGDGPLRALDWYNAAMEQITRFYAGEFARFVEGRGGRRDRDAQRLLEAANEAETSLEKVWEFHERLKAEQPLEREFGLACAVFRLGRLYRLVDDAGLCIGRLAAPDDRLATSAGARGSLQRLRDALDAQRGAGF